MNKIFSKLLIAIAALFTVGIANLAMPQVANAATAADYSVAPAGDSTANVDNSSGSFIVSGDPGQTFDLSVKILNKEDKSRKFQVNFNTAYTADGGTLSFDKTKVTDSALKIQARDQFSPNSQVVTLAAGEEKTVTVKVTVPTESYSGTIMGGVNVKPYKEAGKGTVSSNGTLIKNKFSFSIPIQIRQTGYQKQEPKYSITRVVPQLVASNKGQTVGVNIDVHNAANRYTGSLSSKAVITKKNDSNFKVTSSADGQNIAPTTNYNYSVGWGDESLTAGDYHAKITYTSEDKTQSWVVEKDFTITNADAAKYNKLAGIKPNYTWLYILIGLLVVIIILGLGIYLGRRNKNNNGDNSNGSSRSRRRR
ncbi:DUF3324 domain-containing protein [Companilactobacillus metriopterae]|uniref:DUF3324 domain-containing protein n=1 Tax=Companilactobacillus metriopterae TaxID=1909267 RepID=UPI00100A4D70|nr:DUF3324 domain-containing protein [Companilactobacillus metriopterae]